MDGGTRAAEVLKTNGVEFLFTLAGGHISPVLVGAKKHGIRVVDTRHEVNAVFAADAVARLTGVPGVAAVTAGPGVTNAITAIKNAQLAQSPLVLIGGASATLLRGRGSLQDIDQRAAMEPHVKWLARPNTVREIVPALEEAFERCQSGVPGPVFVELAVDLLYPEHVVRQWHLDKTDKPNMSLVDRGLQAVVRGNLAYRFAFSDNPVFKPAARPSYEVAPLELLDKAAAMLAEAERPLMVLGSQTMLRQQSVPELVAAIEKLQIPVYLSGMARGLLGADHPLLRRHGRRKALREADVVVLSGVPNDFRLDYGAHVARARVISVNLSEEDLNKNRRPQLAVLADPCSFLCNLAPRLTASRPRDDWHDTLRERDAERESEIDKLAAEEMAPINPLRLCRAIDSQLADDSILVGDGGDFIGTAAYTVKARGPLSWLDPGVFGTLGVGAGYALGAKLVRPEADVWLLWGDGAAGFSIMEMDTFVRHGLPVIAVIGNDASWAQIERGQVEILGDDVACRLARTNYQTIAEGCGAKGILVSSEAEVDGALRDAVRLSREGHPVLVNAHLGRSDFRSGSISI